MHAEWRERLFRWFAPAARHSPLSPNGITVLALILNLAAAVLLYRRAFLIAVVLLGIGGLLDAFDGIVARVQGKTSAYGDFLDHFCDRVSDTFLVTGWLIGAGVRLELTVLAMIAVMLNGYIGTQIEATWKQREYESVGRAEFVIGLILYPVATDVLIRKGWESALVAGLTIPEWMALILILMAGFGIIQRFGLASRLSRG